MAMRYRIHALHRDTGQARIFDLRASSERQAERLANDLGYVVSQVEKVGSGNIFRWWIEICGGRSFTFQVALLTWTVFCFIITMGLMMASAPDQSDPMWVLPEHRRAELGAWGFVGLCCPFGTWALIAIPLGFAIVATWGNRQSPP
jgi:hypothetical protein